MYLTVHLSFLQHTSHGEGRQDVSSRTSRSGARCRNSIASCADEQPHIGNYRLLKTIGKGNFAKVKLARHILTGREVKCSVKIGDILKMTLRYTCKRAADCFGFGCTKMPYHVTISGKWSNNIKSASIRVGSAKLSLLCLWSGYKIPGRRFTAENQNWQIASWILIHNLLALIVQWQFI